jgi:O-methyltransferase
MTIALPTAAMSPYLDLLKKCLVGTLYEQGRWTVLGTGRTPIRRFIATQLRKRNITLISSREFDPKRRERGEDWPVIGFTMTGELRLENIRMCIETIIAEDVPGDFLECGVWRGGASIFAKAVFNCYGVEDRTVWLADSFEGMPKLTSDEDRLDADFSDYQYLAVSLERVTDNFRTFGLLDDNVRFIKGWFSETLPSAPVEKLAILRLDGDHYSSTMDVLNALYKKISPGGFVIVDDYFAFAGCKKAVTEFREAHSIRADIVPIDKTAVYWRRLSD